MVTSPLLYHNGEPPARWGIAVESLIMVDRYGESRPWCRKEISTILVDSARFQVRLLHFLFTRLASSHENTLDNHSDRPPPGRGGHGRRWPGDRRQHDHEGRRQQDPPPDGRQGDDRFCRRDGRRLRPAGAIRGEAEGLSVERAPRGHRAGQGVADRPRAAAAGGDDGRGRRPAHPAGDRQRRRGAAERRRAGDRLGRQLRRGGGPGADGPQQPLGRRDRPHGPGDRRRHRRLHQQQHRGGGMACET